MNNSSDSYYITIFLVYNIITASTFNDKTQYTNK